MGRLSARAQRHCDVRGSGSPRRFGAMATHLGGGCAGGSQVRDQTGRGGRSCAPERFKRSRVNKQIGSSIPQINATPSPMTNENFCTSLACGAAAPSAATSEPRQPDQHDQLLWLEVRCYPARYPASKFTIRINTAATRVWSRFGVPG
jgi:hypothetical protein